MTTIVGGLRARLIYDSIKIEIERSITALGWFDAGRQHSPVTFVAIPVDDSQEVAFNTLSLATGDMPVSTPLELGSDYSEYRRSYYLDFYAESQSIGEHLTFDCKDILEGRMPSISRSAPTIEVYDYTQATPPVIATVEIEQVSVDRGNVFNFPWQKFWYQCSFEVVDAYWNENG